MRVLAQRKALDAALPDLEGLVPAAEWLQLEGLAGHRFEVAAFALEDRRRSGKPPLGQHGGENGVTAGVGVSASLPHGYIADACLVEGQVRGDSQVQRLQSLILRQPQAPGRPQDAGDAAHGDVVEPAGLDVHGIADPAKCFIGQNSGNNHPFAPGPAYFAAGQGRGDAIARMTRLFTGIAVVVVQITDHHPVGEGGHIRAGGQAAA